MKQSFLQYVAKDLLKKFGTDLSQIAVVFPNKRASLFLNRYLAQLSNKPIWSPSYITISDLFRQHSNLQVADPIKLICDLHKSFIACTHKNETLDTFYAWGQILLADFDDIDKNMADASKVFAHLKNLHELDDISFLSEQQKKVLKHFFSNFSEQNNTELKKRFLQLWSHLYDIYSDFNKRLCLQSLAYEGALYRKVVDSKNINFQYQQYVFVGFNVLQKVEQQLFTNLKEQNKAIFYWDFDQYYMDNDEQEAGFFIKQYLQYFPNELNNEEEQIYNNLKQPKQITFLSAPTENLQARYVAEWLTKENRIKAGTKTAIVMCNENILKTLIHCIPTQATPINITTGYPLAQSPLASLVNLLLNLRMAEQKPNTNGYSITAVKRILRHPFIKYISDSHLLLLQTLIKERCYTPTIEMLSIDEELTLVFQKLQKDDSNLYLTKWLLNILQLIGKKQRDTQDVFLQEAVFKMYTVINRLYLLIQSGDLKVNLDTYHRLLTQLIQSTTIPFHGEPAEGVQVMGVLETRNLDFDHLLILSCNEGNIPKGTNNASFIPNAIRQAYELTTTQHKVAIYAYYFHRLLQRANDITITYNNATEGTSKGEMSRFMLQLLVESQQPIQRMAMMAGITTQHKPTIRIEKNNNVMQVLNTMQKISPTALNRYLRCPIQFYYHTVANLKEQQPEDDNDNRLFGTIFHRTAELIYTYLTQQHQTILPQHINALIENPQLIENFVDQAFNDELFQLKQNGKKPNYNGLQLINRKIITDYIVRLLKIDQQQAPFRILYLEKNVTRQLDFLTNNNTHNLQISGVIDRMDEITDQQGIRRIRVVDYKTGKLPEGIPNDVEELFDNKNLSKKHKDYYIQTFLYATIVRQQQQLNPEQLPVSPALLYIQRGIDKNKDATLFLNKEKVIDINMHAKEFDEKLKNLLTEIYDTNVPFLPTNDKKTCQYCPYNRLCGGI